jgi:hypothetical protein
MLPVLRVSDRLPRRRRQHLAVGEGAARCERIYPLGFAEAGEEATEVDRTVPSRNRLKRVGQNIAQNRCPAYRHLVFCAPPSHAGGTTKVDGTDIGVVVNQGDAGKGRFALAEAARLLHYYNDYFGVPYPLSKLDLVVAKVPLRSNRPNPLASNLSVFFPSCPCASWLPADASSADGGRLPPSRPPSSNSGRWLPRRIANLPASAPGIADTVPDHGLPALLGKARPVRSPPRTPSEPCMRVHQIPANPSDSKPLALEAAVQTDGPI